MTRYPAAADALEARFGRAVAACLAQRAEAAGPDVAERLRFARERALEAGRAARGAAAAPSVVGQRGGTAVLGRGHGVWGWRFVTALPLVALVIGLVAIQDAQDRTQIAAAADVDAALLGDDLPLSAYKDPGFVEYLKAAPTE